MALDLTRFKLINMTGDGRDGIQGRIFALGTSDDLATATTQGYIDDLINLKVPFLNRQIVDGDVILLEYVLTPGVAPNPDVYSWVPTQVSYDATADSYTLTVLNWGTGGGGGGGTGTVTSVTLEAPSEFVVTGSPVTTSGTITLAKQTQSTNTVFAGPLSGAAAEPIFRALAMEDMPSGVSQYVPYNMQRVQLTPGDTSRSFSVPVFGMEATDLAFVTVRTLPNDAAVLTDVIPGVAALAIQFSANPGTGTEIFIICYKGPS